MKTHNFRVFIQIWKNCANFILHCLIGQTVKQRYTGYCIKGIYTKKYITYISKICFKKDPQSLFAYNIMEQIEKNTFVRSDLEME